MTKAEYHQLADILMDRMKKIKSKNKQKVYINLSTVLIFARDEGFLRDMSKDACIEIIIYADKVVKVVNFWIKKYNSDRKGHYNKENALKFYHDMHAMAKHERIKAENDKKLKEYKKKHDIEEVKLNASENKWNIKHNVKSTKTKGVTMAKSTAKKTTAKTTARKSKTKKTYTYTQVRALIKRALRGRKTVRKTGKSYNTRYAGRIRKGVYTYKLKDR